MKKRWISNKSQAGLITTIILIMVVLVSIVIVWNIVFYILNSSSSQTGIDQFSNTVNIESVKFYIDGSLEVNVKKGSGDGTINSLKFNVYDSTGAAYSVTLNNTNLNTFETKTYLLNKSLLMTRNLIKTVSVYPVLGNKVGMEAQAYDGALNKDSSGNLVAEVPSYLSGLVSWWKFDGNMDDSVGGNHGQYYPNVIDDFEDGDSLGWGAGCSGPVLSIGEGYLSQYSAIINTTHLTSYSCIHKSINVVEGDKISFACKGYSCWTCLWISGIGCVNNGNGSIIHSYTSDWNLYTTTITSTDNNIHAHFYSGSGYGKAAYYDSITFDPSFTSGKSGQAYGFDGVKNYLDCGNDPSLNLNNDNFTISAWIKPLITGTKTILATKGASTTKGYMIQSSNLDKIVFRAEGNSGDQVTTADGNSILLNEWNMVLVTGTSTGAGVFQIKRYLNGQQIGTINTFNILGMENSNNFAIGKYWYAQSPSFFNGSIDNVMIFDRALSADEINSIYNNQK